MKESPTGSEDFRKRNPHLFGEASRNSLPIGKPRIRQSSKPLLNKLETEFLGQLRDYGWQTILCQAVKIRLGNGVWYTPDFITFGNPNDVPLAIWEVKGPHIWCDAIVKAKTAASQYPFGEWRLAHKGSGAWGYQVVRP